MKNRGQHQIIADILRASEKGISKWHLYCECRISPDQMADYLPYLLKRNLISVDEKGKTKNYYRMTALGRLYLDYWKRIEKILA